MSATETISKPGAIQQQAIGASRLESEDKKYDAEFIRGSSGNNTCVYDAQLKERSRRRCINLLAGRTGAACGSGCGDAPPARQQPRLYAPWFSPGQPPAGAGSPHPGYIARWVACHAPGE